MNKLFAALVATLFAGAVFAQATPAKPAASAKAEAKVEKKEAKAEKKAEAASAKK